MQLSGCTTLVSQAALNGYGVVIGILPEPENFDLNRPINSHGHDQIIIEFWSTIVCSITSIPRSWVLLYRARPSSSMLDHLES